MGVWTVVGHRGQSRYDGLGSDTTDIVPPSCHRAAHAQEPP